MIFLTKNENIRKRKKGRMKYVEMHVNVIECGE